MKFSKFFKNPLVLGTLIMTTAGILSRIIGFFYRIFLSRTIGAEALGIYQLITPVFILCVALIVSSIQTSITKFTADSIGQHDDVSMQETKSRFFLWFGMALSCTLAFGTAILIHHHADWLALHLLGERKCAPLLELLSYALLPCCIHNCINGYYYGKKRAMIPSLCQLTEQVTRVVFVWILYQIMLQKGEPLTAYHAFAGVAVSEAAGMFVNATALLLEKKYPRSSYKWLRPDYRKLSSMFLAMVFPMTLSRFTVALCGSLENSLIPQKLQVFGYSSSDALSVYGILTGMTLSIILFPCVLTNSVSVLLLPVISEAKGQADYRKISNVIKKAILYGLLLGLFFTFIFLFSGNWIGKHLFHNTLSGLFIRKLSWLCPLLYLTSLLTSILNGLDKAKSVLGVNLLACLIRVSMIWFLVPSFGIDAYLWGMLLSYAFSSLAGILLLRSYR